MAEQQLKEKVTSGMAWSTAEKIGSMLLQMAVSIIVARLLMPEDFGVMAILTVFTALALIVVDSGFSQMLIRKVSPTDDDYKSVFLLNMAVSWVLYAALALASPFVARFFRMEIISEIAPVLFLILPINALCVIQNTILTREFKFARLSKINITAALSGDALAIVMALSGAGIWSLVGQRLGTIVVRGAMLWQGSSWRARKGSFSTASIRTMAPFSLRIMLTDIISTAYANVAQLFIGKMHSADVLGYFNQAQKLKELPVSSAVQSIQSVTYPALSNLRDNEAKFAEGYRRVIMVAAFAMFPVMAGMIAVSEDMFAVLLGEKWMPTVPYFKVLSLCGMFYPIGAVAYNVLKVKSDGSVIVRLEIAKKAVMTVILAVTIPWSVMAVAWGLVLMTAIDAAINIAFSARFADITVARILRSLLPTLLLTAVMYGCVTALSECTCGWNAAVRLVAEIAAGVAVYTVGALIARMEAMRDFMGSLLGLRRCRGRK